MEPESHTESNYRCPPRRKARIIANNDANVIYTTQKDFFSSDFADLERILSKYHEKLFDEQIFLNAEENDRNRKQQTIASICSTLTKYKREECYNDGLRAKAIFAEIVSALQEYLTTAYPGYQLSAGNVLVSFPSTDVQQWHRDYDPELSFEKAPLVMFTSLSGNSRLDIFYDSLNPVISAGSRLRDHHKQVEIQVGDLLMFHGYSIHRGCAYTDLNFRLHFYALDRDDYAKLPESESTTNLCDIDENPASATYGRITWIKKKSRK